MDVPSFSSYGMKDAECGLNTPKSGFKWVIPSSAFGSVFVEIEIIADLDGLQVFFEVRLR